MKLLEHQLSIMPEHHAQNGVEQCLTNARTHSRRTTQVDLLSHLCIACRGAERFGLSKVESSQAGATRTANKAAM